MQQRYRLALLVVASIGLLHVPPAFADSWTQLTREGSEAFAQCNFGQAERLFRQALKEAESFGDHDLRLATSLTNLGVVLKAHAQEVKAQPLFERAVVIQQNVLGPNSFEVISSIAKLCQFYTTRNQWDKAEPLTARVMTYAQKNVNDLMAPSSDVRHQNYLELAVLLDGLAHSFGSRPQAEPMYRMALQIREKMLGNSHMAIASSAENLARLCMVQNKYAEAEQLYRRAFDISQKTYGLAKPETLGRVEGLAQCYTVTGQSKQAEDLYRRTLTACEQTYGKRSAYTAKIQVGLASTLMKQGRYSEAAPLLSEALRTQENIQGPQNAALTPILDAYADALDRTNRHTEAMQIQTRSKAIRGWM